MSGNIIAGIRLPDSAMAKQSTELLRTHGSNFCTIIPCARLSLPRSGVSNIISVMIDIIRQFPRSGLKQNMISTFFEGFKHKPHTTYGSINADICVCMIPGFQQDDFCEAIQQSPWME